MTFMAGAIGRVFLNFVLVSMKHRRLTPGRLPTHPFDEYLLFFGYDPDDMSYLGSV